jgi:hypothetical protein
MTIAVAQGDSCTNDLCIFGGLSLAAWVRLPTRAWPELAVAGEENSDAANATLW